MHALSPNTAKTFDEYAEKIFIPYLHHQTRNNDRIDVVWDVYRDDSIKTGVREKRGDSARKKITGTASIPHPWQNFLCNSKNKEALFSFISTKLADTHSPEGKTMYVTKQETVFSIGIDEIMENSNHEEADTRMIVHLFHALKCGCKLVQIRTVDTDVIVILLGMFHLIKDNHLNADIYVGFGFGKDLAHYHVNGTYAAIGEERSRALPLFHALTGCDTTSAVANKGKVTAW